MEVGQRAVRELFLFSTDMRRRTLAGGARFAVALSSTRPWSHSPNSGRLFQSSANFATLRLGERMGQHRLQHLGRRGRDLAPETRGRHRMHRAPQRRRKYLCLAVRAERLDDLRQHRLGVHRDVVERPMKQET